MPLIPILWLAGGAGVGFFVGSETSKILRYALIGGGCYFGYKAYKGFK
ncbi:hypothetical protein [Vibrio sp. 03-59-1]|nr:hypothetical protein [Vibrio sp. 03-59-1]